LPERPRQTDRDQGGAVSVVPEDLIIIGEVPASLCGGSDRPGAAETIRLRTDIAPTQS